MVHFQARQPVPEDEYQRESDAEEDDDQYGGENFCDFSVYIENPGKKDSGVIYDCTSNDTEISVNNIQFTSELEKMTKVSRFERGYYYYAGPDFSTLDERLQTGLVEYMQAHGINEHLAAFVEVMSLDKDQRLYMNWLEEVHEFIKS